MAMLIGSLGLINLRVLGYKAELPLLGTRQLLPLAWLGFTMNAISGTLLFTSDAVYFFESYTFRIKMVLIMLGGINAALLGQRVFREAGPACTAIPPTAGTKWIAATSLVFWFGAVDRGAADRLHAVGSGARDAEVSSMEFLVWLESTPIANAIRTIRVAVSGVRDRALHRAVAARRRDHADRPARARHGAGAAAQEHDRSPAVRLGRASSSTC